MRVKCVDDRSSCFVYCGELKKGKEYEVLESRSKMYLLNNDLGYEKWYYEYRFEIIKEDKMEEIRVVRKLEDLDGLENGMGLYLEWEERKNRLEIKKEDNVINWFCLSDVCNLGLIYILDVLKAMGFKFEYKPMRTEQEIKEEVVELTKDRHSTKDYKFLILKHQTDCSSENYYYYKNFYYGEIPFGKACWLTEEEAKMYSKELNEIIGVVK